MIHLDWNPVPHLGPIPVNWYGLGWVVAFIVGLTLARRAARPYGLARQTVEDIATWCLVGAVIGARIYYVAQNEPMLYLTHAWRIAAIWEGGLAFFGGLFGAIAAAYLYTRRHNVPLARVADVFAPAVPLAAAVGRVPCGLAGMDYGTPTRLPWGVVYLNWGSYAPTDGVPRHPDQFYELAGDLVIAAVLFKLRGRLPEGALFLLYLVLFSVLRFFVFFVRGNVAPVALGLKNAQWTALAILVVAVPTLLARLARAPRRAI